MTSATLTGSGVTCAITSKSEASLLLSCYVGHGASPGVRMLTLANAGGNGSFGGALDVTKITANGASATGDATGVGTTNRPFRTLTKAASVAGKGDVVFLRTPR